MNRFRTFRNGDPPALAELWNRSLPGRGVVRPLTPHEFDTLIIGRLDFRREGLIVAEDEGGRIVGFVHAGFGPVSPEGPSQRLDHQFGTIAMLVVDQGQGGELASALFRAGEEYLRGAGAQVFYAGAQYPLDPFYRGVYGGSEFSGILDVDAAFRDTAVAAGYEAVATTARFEADLAGAEIRDPKSVLFRRQARVDVEDEAMPAGWWEAMGIGPVEISRFCLRSRLDNREMARASTWDMAAFGRPDGRARVGLFGVEVPADLRRKGYGRHLVAEILRHHRGRWGEIVAVQTDATNLPALGLYQGLGFLPTGTSTLFRRPGGLPA